MSKEIVSRGAPYTIEFEDRSFGGARTPVLTVSDVDGSVAINTPMTHGGLPQLGTPTVTSTTGAASNTATLQINDASGKPLAGLRRVLVWVSATAGATAVGTSTTGLTTTITTGITIYAAILANLVFDCLTDATGKLVVTLADAAGAETRFANFAVADLAVVSSAAIVTP